MSFSHDDIEQNSSKLLLLPIIIYQECDAACVWLQHFAGWRRPASSQSQQFPLLWIYAPITQSWGGGGVLSLLYLIGTTQTSQMPFSKSLSCIFVSVIHFFKLNILTWIPFFFTPQISNMLPPSHLCAKSETLLLSIKTKRKRHFSHEAPVTGTQSKHKL